jgi:hypothetical protein
MDAVYIETSIVSRATARPSADIQMAALQQQAREWWASRGLRPPNRPPPRPARIRAVVDLHTGRVSGECRR